MGCSGRGIAETFRVVLASWEHLVWRRVTHMQWIRRNLRIWNPCSTSHPALGCCGFETLLMHQAQHEPTLQCRGLGWCPLPAAPRYSALLFPALLPTYSTQAWLQWHCMCALALAERPKPGLHCLYSQISIYPGSVRSTTRSQNPREGKASREAHRQDIKYDIMNLQRGYTASLCG